jgi:RNA-binding protein
LIKVKVLTNSEEKPKEVAGEIACAIGAELVQVLGKSMLFFRPSKKKPKIELP